MASCLNWFASDMDEMESYIICAQRSGIGEDGIFVAVSAGNSAQEFCADEISWKSSIVIGLPEPPYTVGFLLKLDCQAPL